MALHERITGSLLTLHRPAGVGDQLNPRPLCGIHDVLVLLDSVLLRSGYQEDFFSIPHGLVERGDVIVVAHEYVHPLLFQVESFALVANEGTDSVGCHPFCQLFDDSSTKLPGGSSDQNHFLLLVA